jgi:hypothetical protein
MQALQFLGGLLFFLACFASFKHASVAISLPYCMSPSSAVAVK